MMYKETIENTDEARTRYWEKEGGGLRGRGDITLTREEYEALGNGNVIAMAGDFVHYLVVEDEDATEN